MKDDTEETDALSGRLVVGLLILVVGLWSATLTINLLWINKQNVGIYGDMFGSVNALFSGLAFAGVICAILLQKRELTYQRRELNQNTRELRNQADALNKQVELMRLSAQLSSLPGLIDQESIYLHHLNYRADQKLSSQPLDQLTIYIKDAQRVLESARTDEEHTSTSLVSPANIAARPPQNLTRNLTNPQHP